MSRALRASNGSSASGDGPDRWRLGVDGLRRAEDGFRGLGVDGLSQTGPAFEGCGRRGAFLGSAFAPSAAPPIVEDA